MMEELSLRRRLLLRWTAAILYLLATVQLVRFHMASIPGVDIDTYLQGTTPLPFQKRYLPALLIRAMLWCKPLARFFAAHATFMSPPARFCSMIVSTVALGIAGYFCCRLYQRTSLDKRLSFLVYPLFLALVLVSYTVHIQQNKNLPYDFTSVAFFSAGLYLIYVRRFWPLLLVVLCGTLNRETTLFLVPIFVLDAASRTDVDRDLPVLRRFRLRQVPCLRTALLLVAWFVVELTLSRMFAHNDRSQTSLRVRINLGLLRFGYLPNILNMCGYVLPALLIVQPEIRPIRFGNYLLVTYPWIVVMFVYGVILETRIYGELVPYVTVACVLLIEQIACWAVPQKAA